MPINQQILNSYTLAFVANVEQYANDTLYGTSTCSYTLDQLWQQMLLIISATNSCLVTTQEQLQCFQSLMQLPNC